jgi:hypothetical protein
MFPLANNYIPAKELLVQEEVDLGELLAEAESRSSVVSNSILGSKCDVFHMCETLPKTNLPNDGTEETNWPTSSKKLWKRFEESRPRKYQKMEKSYGVYTSPTKSFGEASGSWHWHMSWTNKNVKLETKSTTARKWPNYTEALPFHRKKLLKSWDDKTLRRHEKSTARQSHDLSL